MTFQNFLLRNLIRKYSKLNIQMILTGCRANINYSLEGLCNSRSYESIMNNYFIYLLGSFCRPSIEYDGVPSFPSLVMFGSIKYPGPGLQSFLNTENKNWRGEKKV